MPKQNLKKLYAGLVELRELGARAVSFDETGAVASIEFFEPKIRAEVRNSEIAASALIGAQAATDELAHLRTRAMNAKTPEERQHWQNELIRAESESILYHSS